MKTSRTLTNEELSEKVLEELEDVVLSVCQEVVETIDMQLRKGHNFLDSGQKQELVEHLREKVNLNLTINAGILTKDLASIDIYPRDMLNRGLDSFIQKEEEETKDDTTITFEFPGKEPVTLTKEQFDKLPKAIEDETVLMLPGESLAEYEERKQIIQDKVWREQRAKMYAEKESEQV